MEVDDEQIAAFLPEVNRKLEWLSREDLIKRLVTAEFGRFMRYYADAPEIIQPDDRSAREARGEGRQRGEGSRRDGKGGGKTVHVAEEGYRRLFINRGKRDHFFAREIINIVNRYVKGKVEIGRIDLLPSIAFFEVPEEYAEEVIRMMAKAKVGDRRVVVDWADREDDAARPASRRRPDSSSSSPSPSSASSSSSRRRPASDSTSSRRHPAKGQTRGEAKPERKGKKYSKDDWKQFFNS